MTHTRSRIAPFSALTCVLVLSCTLGACRMSGTTPTPSTDDTPSAQATDADAAGTEETEPDEQTGQAPGDSDAVAGTTSAPSTSDIWSEEACALLRIYPATYVRADNAGDEPLMLTVDDWAQECLPYIDPESELGATMLSDPASIFTPLGYIEAAVVVNDARVVAIESDAVTVEVELEGTQQDWEHTITYTSTYRVSFGSNDLITEVEYLQ